VGWTTGLAGLDCVTDSQCCGLRRDDHDRARVLALLLSRVTGLEQEPRVRCGMVRHAEVLVVALGIGVLGLAVTIAACSYCAASGVPAYAR
jgi:hypothetical protein